MPDPSRMAHIEDEPDRDPQQIVKINPETSIIEYDIPKPSHLDEKMAWLHSRYIVPVDQLEYVTALVYEYMGKRRALDLQRERWGSQRGQGSWDLEHLLNEEQVELFALEICATDLAKVGATLRDVLSTFKVVGREQIPHWYPKVVNPHRPATPPA